MYTIKYLPQNSKQIFGQDRALVQMKTFVENYSKQSSKIQLLYGPPGVGKTASVYALAKELGYEVLELNASDVRKADELSSFLSAALHQRSLFMQPKIVLIDEIDSISGVKDRGCVSALIKAVKKSSFPVICTAHDPFSQKLKSLRKMCALVEFQALDYKDILHALKWVCEQEGLDAQDQALSSLARQAGGDLRAALIDLQVCQVLDLTTVRGLGARKQTDTIAHALRIIFKSSNVMNALGALQSVDVDLDQVFLWLDYNLPKEYWGASLVRAYEALARADIFRGRIRKRQHWRFLVYVNSLLTAGVSAAKDERNPDFVAYKQTTRLLRIWQYNMKLAKKKDIAEKIALATHTSRRRAMDELPYIQAMINKGAVGVARELELTDDELAWLKK